LNHVAKIRKIFSKIKRLTQNVFSFINKLGRGISQREAIEASLIYPIINAIKVSNNEAPKYPFSIQFLK
jgi:uncharacterized Tic20 family protein